jgi:hypothetical protein
MNTNFGYGRNKQKRGPVWDSILLELIGPMAPNRSIMVQLLTCTIFLDAVFGLRLESLLRVDFVERSASKVNRPIKLCSIYP